MKVFPKIMLGCIFSVLITCSVQSVLAQDITDILKPVPIKDAEYQFHLQMVLRDSDGRLISVTESTNGYYIPHAVTDEAFDIHFGKKEIVTVDNIKYEKVQYREKYSLDLPLDVWNEDRDQGLVPKIPKLMFFIPAILEVSYGSETEIVDAYIFQAFVPLVYLTEDDEINTQWTIFRKLN